MSRQTMATTGIADLSPAGRLARYRAMAEHARREANRTAGDARDSYLFIAAQWERLAELAEKQKAPSTTFG